MYGGRDEIVPRAPIRRFVDGLPAEPVRRRKLAWYENGCHMLLRDLQAPVVIADVASWVLTPAAPLPYGADRTAAEWGIGVLVAPLLWLVTSHRAFSSAVWVYHQAAGQAASINSPRRCFRCLPAAIRCP